MAVSLVVNAGDRTRRIEAQPGVLSEILASAGLPLNTRCSQRGLCCGCHVITAGAQPRDLLACQYHLREGEALEIVIPGRSLLSHPPAVVSDFRTGVPVGNDPIFPNAKLGIAVDIGTTTVAMVLTELGSGCILARASGLNAQVAMGDNVLTRIQLCQQDPANVARLQRTFWRETFDPLLKELLRQSGVPVSEIAGVVVAGNTTMLHLASGVDPTPMGTVPFTPEFLDQRWLGGEAVGLSPHMAVVLLPGISAYVGADIAAGAACSGVGYGTGSELFVDVGTNGEMLLHGPNGFFGCATAAGPAFEGCGLLCGMRAAQGVVSRITFERDPFEPRLKVIGGGAPHGITGSAYIDFLAEGRRIGLLAENGRFESAFVAANPDWFTRDDNGWSLHLSPAHRHLRIGEVDVALLLQAKAAIAAGIETLLALQGTTATSLERLLLAGGFGLHLSIPNAIASGLLPGFRSDQISAVGNTSLGGAYLAMLDRALVTEMEDLRESVTAVELNLCPEFEDRFVDHLSLPCPPANAS